MDDPSGFLNYLQQQMLQASPTIQDWTKQAGNFATPDPTGAYMDQYQQALRDSFTKRGLGDVSDGMLQSYSEVSKDAPEWVAEKLKTVMPRMDWAQNVAGDVGNRVNASMTMGDMASRSALLAAANSGNNDELSQFARFLLQGGQKPLGMTGNKL